MKNSIFEYRDYKKYLKDVISSMPGGGHGFRTRLADAVGCQMAYVSRVLNQDAHFSLEQAEELNSFLNHTPEESDFFLLLVQGGRAGSQKLQKRINQQIEEVSKKKTVNRMVRDTKHTITETEQAMYYSAWFVTAIDVLCAIPGFQTKEALQQRLGIPMETVGRTLDFLLRTGLIVQEKGQYQIGPTHMHVGRDSPLISRHHSNFRMRAMQSLERPLMEDLHFTGLFGISRADAERIMKKTGQDIDSTRAIVRESKEEEAYVFCVDFFKL